MLKRGAKVVACCLTDEGAEAARAVGATTVLQFDLSEEKAVEAAAHDIEVLSEGKLWGLVHNAGVVLPGFVDYQPLSFYRRVMEVNFFAPVTLTRALLKPLRRGRGRVVLVSSVDGLVSLPGNAPYDASKFALEAYADALRVEMDFWGISVSVVNPATMRTPMAMGFFEAHRRAWEETQRLEPDGEWQEHWPASWLDEYIQLNTKQLALIAQDPEHAIRDLEHALTAHHPRTRYLSGALAKTVFYALWIGPESWAHRFKRATIRPPPPNATTGKTKRAGG
jgi:NAD(P)-dependent dehydrogenase (short-subunit alcohol dehydrogenase family)